MAPLRALSLLAVYLPTALAECKKYCPYQTQPMEEKWMRHLRLLPAVHAALPICDPALGGEVRVGRLQRMRRVQPPRAA